jgi:hypothetical protein
VGDPDPVWAARGDARLDRGADVVDVDVDVPEPSPPTTTNESPSGARSPLSRSTAAGSSASRRYITS